MSKEGPVYSRHELPSSMNLPSYNTLRGTIIFAGLISTGIIAGHFLLKLQASELQSILEAEVEKKRESVAQRPYLERLEKTAERDREVLAETERWTSLINEATENMSAGDSLIAAKSIFHKDIPERLYGHWAFRSLQRTTVPLCYYPNSRNPIDHFIEAKLQTVNRSLGTNTDSQHLARRLSAFVSLACCHNSQNEAATL